MFFSSEFAKVNKAVNKAYKSVEQYDPNIEKPTLTKENTREVHDFLCAIGISRLSNGDLKAMERVHKATDKCFDYHMKYTYKGPNA